MINPNASFVLHRISPSWIAERIAGNANGDGHIECSVLQMSGPIFNGGSLHLIPWRLAEVG
jgi:hypothetical protein